MVALPKMKSPLTIDVRRRLNDQDSRWPAKAILRVIAMGFEFLAMVLFAAAVSMANENFTNTDGPGDWTDGMALAPVVFALIVDPSILVTLFFVRKSLHPALYMAVEFVIFALCIPATVLSVAGGLFWYWSPAVSDQAGNINCAFFFNEFSPECEPMAYTVGKTQIAAIVFLFLIFILHFVLFVYASVDLHRRRQQNRMDSTDAKNLEMFNQDPEASGARAPSSYFAPFGSEEYPIQTTVTANK